MCCFKGHDSKTFEPIKIFIIIFRRIWKNVEKYSTNQIYTNTDARLCFGSKTFSCGTLLGTDTVTILDALSDIGLIRSVQSPMKLTCNLNGLLRCCKGCCEFPPLWRLHDTPEITGNLQNVRTLLALSPVYLCGFLEVLLRSRYFC